MKPVEIARAEIEKGGKKLNAASYLYEGGFYGRILRDAENNTIELHKIFAGEIFFRKPAVSG